MAPSPARSASCTLQCRQQQHSSTASRARRPADVSNKLGDVLTCEVVVIVLCPGEVVSCFDTRREGSEKKVSPCPCQMGLLGALRTNSERDHRWRAFDPTPLPDHEGHGRALLIPLARHIHRPAVAQRERAATLYAVCNSSTELQQVAKASLTRRLCCKSRRPELSSEESGYKDRSLQEICQRITSSRRCRAGKNPGIAGGFAQQLPD